MLRRDSTRGWRGFCAFWGVVALSGWGCSTPESTRDTSTEPSYLKPAYAEGFRWRSLNCAAAGQGASCLEILTPNRSQVLTTVYRDSAAYLNDTGIPKEAEAVVLASQSTGLTTLSSTHVALMEPWDPNLTSWSGGGYLEYVQNPVAEECVAQGRVLDFGGSPEWDREAIAGSTFRAFCIYPYGNPLEGMAWAESVPVVPILEYLEPTPLGRAEWMKALAWLVDEPAMGRADSAFGEIAAAYEQLKQQPISDRDSMVVFTGSVDQGAWSAPGGESFIARLLKDAGAKYLFADRAGAENIAISIEEMVVMRDETDAWGMVLYHPEAPLISRQALMALDPRNQMFLPRSGKVFVANTAECDYFGWWVAHPEAMLANLRELFYAQSADIQDFGIAPCFQWIAP